MTTTSIEWTQRVWNPVRGCSLVSAGCRSCYAMRQAHRFSGPGGTYEGLTKMTPAGPQWTGAVRLVPEALEAPLRWRKPARVFVNSMSDLFHDDVPDEFIDQVFVTMQLASRHTFQVLTKRPERMLRYLSEARRPAILDAAAERSPAFALRGSRVCFVQSHPPSPFGWPLPNVWLGVSCEDQRAADERIHLLLQTPAAVRFLSCEPLLGPIALTNVGTVDGRPMSCLVDHPCVDDELGGVGVDWVIVGGESGPSARPCDTTWIRSLVGECHAAGVACFVKQMGARPTMGGYSKTAPMLNDEHPDVRLLKSMRSAKGGEPAEWPTDLRVREFPQTSEVRA